MRGRKMMLGAALFLGAGAVGCQTYELGQVLPSPYFMRGCRWRRRTSKQSFPSTPMADAEVRPPLRYQIRRHSTHR